MPVCHFLNRFATLAFRYPYVYIYIVILLLQNVHIIYIYELLWTIRELWSYINIYTSWFETNNMRKICDKFTQTRTYEFHNHNNNNNMDNIMHLRLYVYISSSDPDGLNIFSNTMVYVLLSVRWSPIHNTTNIIIILSLLWNHISFFLFSIHLYLKWSTNAICYSAGRK